MVEHLDVARGMRVRFTSSRTMYSITGKEIVRVEYVADVQCHCNKIMLKALVCYKYINGACRLHWTGESICSCNFIVDQT